MVPEVYFKISNIQKLLGSFRCSVVGKIPFFCTPWKKTWKQKRTLPKSSQEFSPNGGAQGCVEVMTREEVRFVLQKHNALGSNFCPDFFSRFRLWPGCQVSVKLQAGHWGMYESGDVTQQFFFGGPKYINIIINRKIRSEVQVTVQWFLMWGFFSRKSQANRLSPLVFLQDDDIWGSPDTAEAMSEGCGHGINGKHNTYQIIWQERKQNLAEIGKSNSSRNSPKFYGVDSVGCSWCSLMLFGQKKTYPLRDKRTSTVITMGCQELRSVPERQLPHSLPPQKIWPLRPNSTSHGLKWKPLKKLTCSR